MNFRQHRPAPPLDRFVETFWYYDTWTPDHRTERVLPEGTFELIINLRDEPRHTFDPTSLRPVRSYRKAWISGAQSEYLVIDTAPNSSMMGVHFKPGGAAPFLGLPANELSQKVEDLDCVWGGTARELREALLHAPDSSSKFRALTGFLLRRLDSAAMPHPAVEEALARLSAEPRTATVEALQSRLGMSHKHFIELFREAIGLTPKRFCRIRRFQQVLHDLRSQRQVRWTDVACAGGYYDQAHLIKEFQAFCGISPASYLDQRAGSPNYVPIE